MAGVALVRLGWLWWRAWGPLVASDAALCMAGVALGDINLRFAWRAWHLCQWASHVRGPKRNIRNMPASLPIKHGETCQCATRARQVPKVPRLPRKTKVDVTPATQSDGGCCQVPRLMLRHLVTYF